MYNLIKKCTKQAGESLKSPNIQNKLWRTYNLKNGINIVLRIPSSLIDLTHKRGNGESDCLVQELGYMLCIYY